ncbi:hypothetical protein DFQ26_006247 [Actinomortierella ambigua]|nr:hypothetical protein DFQ26_006247 [Actinomortierella ambigua]
MSSANGSINSDIATKTDPSKLRVPWYFKLRGNKGLLLAMMSSAQLLDIINIASVTITLPDLLKDVGYESNQLQWVVSAYALAYSGFLVIGGRFGDLFGHRRIFLSGVIFFSIWSLVNGFARNPIFMSVSRALQGMGAGFTIPSALAILTTTHHGEERTKAIAFFGGSGAIGGIVGVLLGGIFGDTIGWQWIFFLTSILGFIIAFLAFLVIPHLTHIPPEDKRIDIAGAASFVSGIVLLIYYLSESPSLGWASGKTLGPLVASIVLLIAFVVIEFKIAYPIMPPRIWRSRRFTASTITAIVIMATAQIINYYASLAFQNVMGYSPLQTALAFLVQGIGAVLVVASITRLVKFVRTKVLILVGWVLVCISGIIFSFMEKDTSYWAIPFPALIVNVLGMAPVWVCSQLNAVADAADEDQGVVGSIYNAALQFGGPIGIAVATVVVDQFVDLETTKDPAELMRGYKTAFYTMSVFSGVGFLVVLLLAANQDPIHPQQDHESEAADQEHATKNITSATERKGEELATVDQHIDSIGESASPSINASTINLEKGNVNSM